jgi:hypothetical protein
VDQDSKTISQSVWRYCDVLYSYFTGGSHSDPAFSQVSEPGVITVTIMMVTVIEIFKTVNKSGLDAVPPSFILIIIN